MPFSGPLQSTLPEENSFIGIVKASEEPRTFISFVKNADSGSREYLWRDVVGMAEAFGTEPICIDAIEDLDDEGGSGPGFGSNRFSNHFHQMRESGQLVPFKADLKHYLHVRTPPEQHMAYAATWFTLTAAISFMAWRRVGSANRVRRAVARPQ